jgi:hypothetical protein
MNASKHGLHSAGFMLCDRCVSNVSCEHFVPKGRCWVEQEAFGKISAQLTDEFELDTVADRILVERAAMYLVRIMRAEAYEAGKGVSEKSAQWGMYISRLDNTVRGLFNDLAISRLKRRQYERGEALLVSLDEVLKKFARAEQKTPEVEAERKRLARSPRRELLRRWRREYPKLRQVARRRAGSGQVQNS